jgi:hypothetical protein
MANGKDKNESSSPGVGTALLMGILAIVVYGILLATYIGLYAAAGAAVGALVGFVTGGPPGAAAGAALGAAVGAGVGVAALLVNGIGKSFNKKEPAGKVSSAGRL